MNRRAALCSLSIGLTLGTAGCLDAVVGEAAQASAGESRIPKGDLTEADYSVVEEGYTEYDYAVEALGEELEVMFVIHQSLYERHDFGDSVGVISLYTIPTVEVGGDRFAPFHGTQRRAFELSETQDDVGELKKRGSGTISALGQTIEMDVYDSVVEGDGNEVPIVIRISETVKMDGDTFAFIAYHPAAMADEWTTQSRLLSSVVHESRTEGN